MGRSGSCQQNERMTATQGHGPTNAAPHELFGEICLLWVRHVWARLGLATPYARAYLTNHGRTLQIGSSCYSCVERCHALPLPPITAQQIGHLNNQLTLALFWLFSDIRRRTNRSTEEISKKSFPSAFPYCHLQAAVHAIDRPCFFPCRTIDIHLRLVCFAAAMGVEEVWISDMSLHERYRQLQHSSKVGYGSAELLTLGASSLHRPRRLSKFARAFTAEP